MPDLRHILNDKFPYQCNIFAKRWKISLLPLSAYLPVNFLTLITCSILLCLFTYINQLLKKRRRGRFHFYKQEKPHRKSLGVKAMTLTAVIIYLLRGFQLPLLSSTPQLLNEDIISIFLGGMGLCVGFLQNSSLPDYKKFSEVKQFVNLYLQLPDQQIFSFI